MPGDLSLQRWKASLLSNLGEHAAAARILRDLTEANPAMAELWISLGDALRTMGQSADAHAAYRHATEALPTLGAAWWSLAALRYAPFSETDRENIKAALAARADPDNRYYLHFALATAFEQVGAHREAFGNFAAGNAVRFANDPFDPVVAEQQVETSRRVLTPQFFTRRSDAGYPATDPIFIVSLPRSG
jgi:cytochrome c-type biogenesis protein CcmH/NrfG